MHQQNPDEQLEQLRRNSLMGPGDLKMSPKKDIPKRRMPSSSATIPEEAVAQPHGPVSMSDGPAAAAKPVGVAFNEPTFAAPAKSSATKEEGLSPTETRETKEMLESKDRLAKVPQL